VWKKEGAMHIHSNSTLARIGLAAMFLVASSSVTAHAADPPKNVSAAISDLRGNVVSAEVWIAPRFLESRTDITVERLRSVGCSYLAVEKQDLDPLLEVLANAAFVADDKPESYFPKFVAVYLTRRSGAVVELLLDREYDNAPSVGMWNGETPVVAKRGFERELRAWAAKRMSTKQTASCQK
jgi:hypothetical protein